jgi:mannose-6-phosphate isomerase-like protein (cupin superfamily)
MSWSRRDVVVALPALLTSLPAGAAPADAALPSKIYQFDQLTPHPGNNMVLRDIFDGHLSQGMPVSLHESDLGPHGVPHPPHRHAHEEMILLMQGTLEFFLNGSWTRAEAGSLLFAAPNDEHGIRNPTEAHAKYFVLALGPSNA